MRVPVYPHGGEEPQRPPLPADVEAALDASKSPGAFIVDTLPTLLKFGTSPFVREQAGRFVEAHKAWQAAHDEWRDRQPIAGLHESATLRLFGGDEIAIWHFAGGPLTHTCTAYCVAVEAGVPEETLREQAQLIYRVLTEMRASHEAGTAIAQRLHDEAEFARRKNH